MEPSAHETSAGPNGSTCYTDAEGYNYQVPPKRTLQNAFKFETEELKQMYADVDPGNCAVTEQMKNFDPLEKTLQYGSAAPQRLIFYPRDNSYSDEEKQALKEFKEHCKKIGQPIPDVDEEVMRALTKFTMNITKAYDSLLAVEKIRQDLMPIAFTQRVSEIVQSGYLYIGGRDRHFRPYLVINPHKMFSLTPLPKPEEGIAVSLLLYYFMCDHMFYDGSIENIIAIQNQEGLSLWNMQWSLMKNMMPVVAQLQAGRSRGMYILNAISSFSVIFKAVSYFLPATTLQKVQVTSSPTNDIVNQLIAPEQLEEKFGGKVPNREEGTFWPPRLPSDHFDNENAVGSSTVAGGNASTS